jgi:hypothetical protein
MSIWERAMGNEYRAEKDIVASELFDGRLKKFDVYELADDLGHRGLRYLTDGENDLRVPINEAGYATGFARGRGSPEKILSAISDAFQTRIFRYGEPEYFGIESEEEKAAWASKKNEVKEWLAICKAEGLNIDPETAEVDWDYAQTLDPYGVYPDLPEEWQQIGREYFARSPGSDIWVEFGDLPKKTRDALWERLKTKLASSEELDWLFRDASDGCTEK